MGNAPRRPRGSAILVAPPPSGNTGVPPLLRPAYAARILRRAAAPAALALLLFVSVGRGDAIGPLDRAAAPYQRDLLRWEAGHFLDKWWHRAASAVEGNAGAEARRAAVDQFFDLREPLARARLSLAAAPDAPAAQDALAGVEAVERRRAQLQPVAEEAIEAAVSAALHELGVIDAIGPVRWPPVDFTFAPGGLLLVRSPLDRVQRLPDRLLRADVDLLSQAALENRVEVDDPAVSALVVRIGGVATYPAHVTPDAPLHPTLALVAHEWMHHWLIFRPLGRAWWDGGEMTSINETLADIVAEEMGDLALFILTGERVERPPWQPPTAQPAPEPPTGGFDFNRYMRETRLRLDDLLADGRVVEAQAWLEERRLGLQAQGVLLRKLNTAYFAFYGTYAGDPRGGGVNPIESQLRTLRAAAPGLAAFVDQIARIDRPGQLERQARAAGWRPDR